MYSCPKKFRSVRRLLMVDLRCESEKILLFWHPEAAKLAKSRNFEGQNLVNIFKKIFVPKCHWMLPRYFLYHSGSFEALSKYFQTSSDARKHSIASRVGNIGQISKESINVEKKIFQCTSLWHDFSRSD